MTFRAVVCASICQKHTDSFRLSQLLLQVLVELGEELVGGHEGLVLADQDGEVLGHVAGFDGFDTDFLQGMGELALTSGVPSNSPR